MLATQVATEGLTLRPTALLMQPRRLSAQKPMPLSFSRLLLTRMIEQRWRIEPTRVQVDEEGRGVLVLRIETPERPLHAVVASDRLPKEEQSDRAIATRWDLMLTLVEGDLDAERTRSILAAPPRDGGSGADPRFGRVDGATLAMVCANRSSRVFDHTIDALAAGHQPDVDTLASASYLVRGINYVANGMMGTRMLDAFEPDHPLRSPYFAQMLGCYLVREVSCELVDAIARRRSAGSATLDPSIRAFVGVGNSTGIGLGLMINRHPQLVDRWLVLRETALAQARGAAVGAREASRLLELLDRCVAYREQDRTDPGFFTPSSRIAADLRAARPLVVELRDRGSVAGVRSPTPWAALLDTVSPRMDMESEETLHALIVEVDPGIARALAPLQHVQEAYDLAPEMSSGALRELVADGYRWAIEWDLGGDGQRHWLWYRTAAGGEPRVAPYGGSDEEARRNVALDMVGEVQALWRALAEVPASEPVGLLVMRRPELRAIAERVQSLAGLRYHSPIMNMLARDFVPIDLGRFVLWALKGMEKPSPRNNIWIRGVMMQGAPTSGDIGNGAVDDWIYPARPRVGA